MSRFDELLSNATPRPWNVTKWATEHKDAEVRVSHPISMGSEAVMVSPRYTDGEADAAFIVALVNHAEDFKRLWEAALRMPKPINGYAGITTDVRREQLQKLVDALEPLRPLFGETDE